MAVLSPHRFFALNMIFILFSGFYITLEGISALRPLRYSVLAVIVLISFIAVFATFYKGVAKKNSLLFALLLFATISYGVVLSVFFGGSIFFEDKRLIAFLILSFPFGLSLINLHQDFISNSSLFNCFRTSRIFDVFFIGGLIFLILSQALDFSPLPDFNFEDTHKKRSYSQQTTGLFGLGAVYFLYKGGHTNNAVMRIYFVIVAFAFLFLSTFGGARGDFIISVIVFLLLLLRVYPLWFAVLSISVAVFCISYIVSSGLVDLQDIPFFHRFKYLITSESFGNRDILLFEGDGLWL